MCCRPDTDVGRLTFLQVPSVTYTDDDGHTFDLVQSHAILRFLGRRHQFYGTSEHEEILIDIAMGGVGDMRAKYSKLAYDPAVQTNPSLLEEYKAKYLPLWLGHFQRLLLKAGKMPVENCVCATAWALNAQRLTHLGN